jgi:PAS domain-containing protein
MMNSHRGTWHARWLPPIIVIFSLCLSVPSHAGQGVKILLINSYHHGFKWTDDIVSGVMSTLKKDDELRIEYLDTRRISSKEYLANLYEAFRLKFKGQRYDVIIVSDDPALDLMLDLRAELFPATPVVFCGINDFTDIKLREQSLITGVIEDIDLKETLDIAHKLHPKSRRVLATVNSNATGIANRHLLEKIIPQFTGVFEIEIVQDPELTPFLDRLKQVPKDDYLVLLTGRFKSSTGLQIPIEQSTPRIAETGIPAYSLWEFYLGHGIVGGRLTNGFYQGQTAGEISRRIFNGEQQIPVVRTSPNAYMFDFRELQRFGVDERLLPEGSVIINKPASFYARYREAIWIVLAIALTLSAIIAYLSRIIVQKNKAQEELRHYQATLESKVAERTHELAEFRILFDDAATVAKLGVYEYDVTTGRVTWDDSMLAIYGVNRQDFDSTYDTWQQFIVPEDRTAVATALQAALHDDGPLKIPVSGFGAATVAKVRSRPWVRFIALAPGNRCGSSASTRTLPSGSGPRRCSGRVRRGSELRSMPPPMAW